VLLATSSTGPASETLHRTGLGIAVRPQTAEVRNVGVSQLLRQDLLDAGDCLVDRLLGPDVERLRLALGSLKPLVASLIFASRARGVELRFSSPPKSQGTLAEARRLAGAAK
jgi:hypothetical protein